MRSLRSKIEFDAYSLYRDMLVAMQKALRQLLPASKYTRDEGGNATICIESPGIAFFGCEQVQERLLRAAIYATHGSIQLRIGQ